MYKGLNKLRKMDADFSICDNNGWPSVFHACGNCNIKYIDWLIKNNMENIIIDAKDFDNRSIPLHYAMEHQSTAAVKYVIENNRNSAKIEDINGGYSIQ